MITRVKCQIDIDIRVLVISCFIKSKSMERGDVEYLDKDKDNLAKLYCDLDHNPTVIVRVGFK